MGCVFRLARGSCSARRYERERARKRHDCSPEAHHSRDRFGKVAMRNRSKVLAVFGSLPVQGAIVGMVATQALDIISTLIYEREDRRTFFNENRARHFTQAYEVAVSRVAHAFGRRLSRREAQIWGWRFHKAFGAFGGVQYMAARRKRPSVGNFGGLGFGTAFFAVVDELLMPLLKLTPGPQKFSWKVHARGAISHIAYGVAAELTARGLERTVRYLESKNESNEEVPSIVTTKEKDLESLLTNHTRTTTEAFTPRLA
jgi:hypothetical protein